MPQEISVSYQAIKSKVYRLIDALVVGEKTEAEVQDSIRRWWDLIHPADRPIAQKYLMAVLTRSGSALDAISEGLGSVAGSEHAYAHGYFPACRVRDLQLHSQLHRRQTRAAGRLQGQSGAAGECGQPVRLHAAIQRARIHYEKYKDQGFVILGFPANNFGAQEPGTNEEIKTFCTRKYSVTFPMYSKISVKGADQAPLYAYLTKETGPGITGDIKWNFTKFLVDRNGKVVQRFESAVTPDSKEVTSAIEKQLK
jgi:glutathione peroxidase-family protein